MSKQKKNKNEYAYIWMSFLMFIAGIGTMFWSAATTSWLRLLIGIIFIIFSVSYSHAWKEKK